MPQIDFEEMLVGFQEPFLVDAAYPPGIGKTSQVIHTIKESKEGKNALNCVQMKISVSFMICSHQISQYCNKCNKPVPVLKGFA